MDDSLSLSEVRTFLIADIRGYTRFTREQGDEAAARLASRFAELTEQVVTLHEGRVVELRGDEALCVFPSARNALRCCLALQASFVQAREADPTLPLAVGIGLDAGDAVPVKGGYRGGALNLAARLCAIAQSDEVLATRTVTALSGAVDGIRYVRREPVKLKGIADPVEAVAVTPAIPPASQRKPPALQLRGGMAAFLYTDIEGSTRLWQEHPNAMPHVVTLHDAVLRDVVERHEGLVFRNVGDGCCAAFARTEDALLAAIEAQRAVQAEVWGDGIVLRVRMAIHAGSVEVRADEYVGHTLNRVARLLSAAHGGQTLLSQAACELMRDALPADVEMQDLGEYRLKDLAEPEHVYQVVVPDLPATFPPLVSVQDQTVTATVSLPTGGFLGSLPTGRLVGRDAELDRLLAAANQVERGEGRLVLLTGEPGIGKTRLAQEATAALRDLEFILAAGRCYEPEQNVPYYPFLDALTMAFEAAPISLRRDAGRRWPYLATLLPRQIDAPRMEAAGGPEDQQNVFRAVADFLGAVSAIRPLGLLIDDLHWVDSTSLRLLVHLAQHTRTQRILILGTYRNLDVDRHHPLERALRDLYRDGLLERIVVCGLTQDETRALLAARLAADIPESVAAFVYRQTEGNPFYTQEVLQALVERGDVYHQDGRWEWSEIDKIEVPENVRMVLGERLSRLEEQTREILGAASVLGQTFRFDELQALGGYGEEDVEEALDESVRRGIIRETSDDYRFNHALTQAALYTELSGRRKRRLHRAAGEALEPLIERWREGREAELAWHFLEGEDWARALSYSLLAGDKAEVVFAHGEATQHYYKARDLARRVGDYMHLREALRKLGGVLSLVGRYDAAGEALEEAVRLARQAHDLDDEIGAVTSLLRHAPERGKQDDVLRWVEPLLPRLEDYPDSPTKLSFLNAYAYFLVQTVQFDEGLQVARQTVEIAGALGDDYELARSKVVLGHLLLWHGRGSETKKLLDPVVQYLEDAGDLPEAMRAASLLAQVDWFHGDLRASLRWRERSLRLSRQAGDAAQAVYETCMLGYLHLRLGNMDLAWKEGLHAVTEARAMDRSTMPGSPLGLLATVSWIQGAWADVTRCAEEMISLSDHSDEPWWRRHGEYILAIRELLEGQPARALARLEPQLTGAQLDIQEQALFLPALAEAYLKTGNLQRAREVLAVPLALRGREMQGMLTDALRVHAMLLCASADFAEAETVLKELLDVARAMPYPFAEAQALTEYAHLEAARNRPGAAPARLGEALVIFRRLAAQPFAEQTERILAQIAP